MIDPDEIRKLTNDLRQMVNQLKRSVAKYSSDDGGLTSYELQMLVSADMHLSRLINRLRARVV